MQPTVYDVSPGRSVPIDRFTGSINEVLRWGGNPVLPGGRYDSADGFVGGEELQDAWNVHVDAQLLRECSGRNVRLHHGVIELAQRSDAMGPGAGGFPRDFEFVRRQIFEEKRQPLTSMELFPVDSSVPLGARKHTARRSIGSGEAQIFRGGTEIPRARTSYLEETFNVAYIVCAVDQNFFDALTTDFAGLQQFTRDMRLSLRLVEERMNRIAWFGDPDSGLYGVLNYPHVAKQMFPVAINDSAVPEDIQTALSDLVNTPMIESGGTFMPNVLVVSPRIHAFLFSRKHSTTGGTDTSIGEYFLRGQRASGSGVQAVRMAPELAGIGPAGEDGILAYRADLDSLGNVIMQAPTSMPVFQSSPFDQTTVVYSAIGGVVMPDVGNHIIAYAQV